MRHTYSTDSAGTDERAHPPAPPAPAALEQIAAGLGNRSFTRKLARDPASPFPPMMPAPVGDTVPAGPSHGTPIDQLKVAKWTTTAPVEGPEVPQPVAIAVPEVAPKATGWAPSRDAHEEDRWKAVRTPQPVMGFEAEQQRRRVWSAYRGVVYETVRAHNELVQPIATYEGFAADPSVAAAGFKLQDVSEKAEARVVPRTNRSRVTVGSLFTPAGKGAKPGTTLQTPGLEDDMKRASASATVEEHRAGIDKAGLEVKAGLEKLKRVALESQKAGHELAAATAGVDAWKAGDDKKKAEKELKAAEEQAAEWKTWIGRGLKAVALLSGALAPIVIATEAAGAATTVVGGLKSAGTVKSIAESSITSTIAEKAVDLFHKSDIEAATKKIAAAEAALHSAQGRQATETRAGAEKGFAASLIAVKEATLELQAKMKAREQALMQFGNAAAAAGGGSQAEQDRMRAIVQALPVAESVIATTENILAAVRIPPHDDEAGRGLNLARYHHSPDAQQFLHAVGLIKGYENRFKGVRDTWQARAAGLRTAVDKMAPVIE